MTIKTCVFENKKVTSKNDHRGNIKNNMSEKIHIPKMGIYLQKLPLLLTSDMNQ